MTTVPLVIRGSGDADLQLEQACRLRRLAAIRERELSRQVWPAEVVSKILRECALDRKTATDIERVVSAWRGFVPRGTTE